MITNYKKYRIWTYMFSLVLIFGLIFLFPNTKYRLIDKTISDFTNNPTDQTEQIFIFTKAL